MNSLFIIEAMDKVGYYGQTDYCIVKAETKHEAIKKAKEKYSGDKEEILNRDAFYPNCKISFDENGISKIVRHVW